MGDGLRLPASPKMCQADAGSALAVKEAIENDFLCYRGFQFGLWNWARHEQNSESGAKL
jgi:hypothetical protein